MILQQVGGGGQVRNCRCRGSCHCRCRCRGLQLSLLLALSLSLLLDFGVDVAVARAGSIRRDISENRDGLREIVEESGGKREPASTECIHILPR